MTASKIVSLPDLMPESKTEPPHFEQFWKTYPLKVAKLAAKRAWLKAAKFTTFEEIMDGVERYKNRKPDYADWCHPATWLNGGRWMDDYSAVYVKPMKQSVFELKTIMEAKERAKKLLFDKYAYESPTGIEWGRHTKEQGEYLKLKKEIRLLNDQIGGWLNL